MRTEGLGLLTDIVEAAREHERVGSVHREPVEVLDPEGQPTAEKLGYQIPELAAGVCCQVLGCHPCQCGAGASADTAVDLSETPHQALDAGLGVPLVIRWVRVIALQKRYLHVDAPAHPERTVGLRHHRRWVRHVLEHACKNDGVHGVRRKRHEMSASD